MKSEFVERERGQQKLLKGTSSEQKPPVYSDDLICACLALHIYSMTFQTKMNLVETNEEKLVREQVPAIAFLRFHGKFSNAMDMQCAVYSLGPRYFLVFRGSESIKDWFVNSLFFSTKVPGFAGPRSADGRTGPRPLKVHSGFYRQVTDGDALAGALDVLNQAVAKNPVKRESVRLTITGHSLGGAQSVIAAYLLYRSLHHDFHRRISVLCFGAPRGVSVQEYIGFMKRTGTTVRNYIYLADPVPFLPPFVFHHPGEVYQFTADQQWELFRKEGKQTARGLKRKFWSRIWHFKPADHAMEMYLRAIGKPDSFAVARHSRL
jgi:hypothetical protein